jgi:hypothetical protein
MTADAPAAQSADPSRRLRRLGLVLAVFISLAATCYPVFSPFYQHLYSTNPDAMEIVPEAEKATWHDALGWWTGPWIETSMPYYRPLTSMMFWAEYHLFGRDFEKYCVISWLAHACGSAVLFLLVLSLLRERPLRVGVALGLLAVLLFNTRRNLVAPGWQAYPIAWGEMPYWAAQTDIFSLLFSLLSLLVLDRWCQEPTRRRLAGAVALFAVALLFKEMAVATALLAPIWVWYRSPPPASGGGPGGGYRRRIPWEVLGLYLGLGVVFLLVRWWFVPGAWGPKPPVPMKFGVKVLFYLNYELFYFYGTGTLWPIPTALGLVALVWALRRYRQSLIWLLPGALIWTLLTCQVFAGNFAQFTIPKQAGALGLSLLFWGGLVVFLRSRSRLSWTLAAMVAVVHLPIMHLFGPHYQYWPASFWSLLSVSLVLSAGDWWQALGEPPPAPGKAQRSSSDPPHRARAR